jgi:antirestriction protein
MSNSYEPRIFIGTPQAPARGEWLSLPCDEEELNDIIHRIAGNGDFIISDKEDLPGVDEYTCPQEANEYAEWLVTEEPEADLLEAFINNGTGIDEIPALYKKGDFTIIEGDTEEDLGANYIEEMGGVENALSPDTIASYFDYEKFGRDLTIDGFQQFGSHWINLC